MNLFTNPYRTIRDLKLDVECAEDSKAYWLAECFASRNVNAIHAEANGKLRAQIDNLEAKRSEDRDEILCLFSDILQTDKVIAFHMEEREDLQETIYDLEEEVADLEEEFEELVDDIWELSESVTGLLDTIEKQQADIKMLNGLLIEGSQAFDELAESGAAIIAEALVSNGQDAQELAQAKWAYEGLEESFNAVSAELAALKASNTQSLSWVRQAEEALDEYGIRIDDTPVGPAVLIDRDAFINRVALDNVTAAPV